MYIIKDFILDKPFAAVFVLGFIDSVSIKYQSSWKQQLEHSTDVGEGCRQQKILMLVKVKSGV